MDKSGAIPIRKLAQNWARHQELSTDQFKELLDATVHFNLGTWGDGERKTWRPCIDPGKLPSDDDL